MRKTRFAASMMWVSIILLTVETVLGRLIVLKVRRLLLVSLILLDRLT